METLRYVVLVNGLLAVVSLAYYVLLRRETFFGANRLALWLGLLSAFVLPLLELPDWRPQPVRTVMQRTAQVIVPNVLPNISTPKPDVTITFPNGKTFSAFQQRQPAGTWPWQYVLVGVYALGVFLLSCRFLWQLSSLRKLIRQSLHEPYDGFTLVCNETITSPFSFFNWVVLNPDRHMSAELEQILRHERVHVRERHSFDMIAAELVCILFWFNPAAYLFRHLIHQTLEFSADRAVLAEGVDAKLYQYNLLKVSLSEGRSALTNHFSKLQLKSRIVMLNKPDSSKAAWLKYPVFLIAVLTVASAFARPQMGTINQHLFKPVATRIVSSIEKSVFEQPLLTTAKPANTDNVSVQEKRLLNIDSLSSLPKHTEWRSLSPFIEIQGNTLYWIITPLTTFDDIAQLKAEVAKYGYRFEIDEMKFDMLHKFLVRVDATMASGNAQGRRTTDDVAENKPMQSFGGQISIAEPGILGLNEITSNSAYPTKHLADQALTDEKIAQNLLKQHRIDYLIAEGLSLTKENWITKQYQFNGRLSKPILAQTETGISVDSLGKLQINRAAMCTYWLNNRAVAIADLEELTGDKIHSLITRDKFFDNKKMPQRIVLIYTK